VPCKGPQTVGEALDLLAQQEQKQSKGAKRGGRVKKQQAAKRQKCSPTPIEVEINWEGLEGLVDDNIGDCIVVG
jgi:hypothetical protein